MSLSSGTRLGPYEIQAAIAAGGMGEVYRARDTRLDRTVAIKILPAHLSSNQDSKQRFEREARTISSLSHPYICALHDVGHQDGIDYLVMEFLEGESLAQRLSKGPLTTELVFRYGIQIADALDKAHRRGIVHRDLKPGNVMITKSGAKLLDFGLAKLSENESEADSHAVSQFATKDHLTEEGVVLGTVQYMAPEQLEGKSADSRTDIFALGEIIYEMATGQKAFSGQSKASLISAILKEEPLPVSQVQPLAPLALDHLVKKCLAKDPEDRWQNAQDVGGELQWIAEGSLQSKPTGTAAVFSPKRFKSPWMITTVLFLLSTLALIYALTFNAHPKAPLSIFSIAPPAGYAFDRDVNFAISPDGRKLAFVATDKEGRVSLWLRDFGVAESRMLTILNDDLFDPYWSSDSLFVGFCADVKLKAIGIDGTPARTICNSNSRFLNATWNRDKIIFANRDGLFTVSASGGVPTKIFGPDKSQQENLFSPFFLPDGHHFLYSIDSSIPDVSGIYVGSLDSKERKRILPNVSKVAYSPPGYLLFKDSGALMAQPFDAARLLVTANAFSIVSHGMEGGFFSVAQNGLLGYSNTGFSRKQLLWFDRGGKRISSLGEPGIYFEPSLSPDGKKIAMAKTDPDQDILDIWQIETSEGRSSRFTFNTTSSWEVGAPVWSPDGKTIAYSSGNSSQIDLLLKAADGSKKEEVLVHNTNRKWVDDWSADGRYISYYEVTSPSDVTSTNANYDIWFLPLFGERKPIAYLQTRFNENHGAISPDDRWLAYTSDESGRPEVYVRTFPDPNQGKWQISTAGGDQAHWRSDGRELFYMTPQRNLMTVEIKPGLNFEAGAQKLLFQAPVAFNNPDRDRSQYCVSSDGQRFLVNSVETETQPQLISVILNWTVHN